jgi:TM2 domain-containing membrane protein YozV
MLGKADSLFESGNYEESGLFYEWVIYSGTQQGLISRAAFGRIESFKQLGQYERAARFIDQLPKVSIPDSVLSHLIYESLLANYLSGNYQEVISRYLMSGRLIENTQYTAGSDLLICLSKLRTGEYMQVPSSAESYIRHAAPAELSDSLMAEFRSLFDPGNTPKLKNPRTARILSMIIPGSGQIYAGYPGDGLISFGLHALAIGGAGLAFINGLYITGWIGGFGVLQKLYFGGNHRAAELAEEKNRLKKESFIQPAVNFLIGISDGEN